MNKPAWVSIPDLAQVPIGSELGHVCKTCGINHFRVHQGDKIPFREILSRKHFL